VYDVADDAMKRVDGFRTAEREAHGGKRVVGPSSVAIGEGFAYVGNRASSEICPVDTKTLKPGACVTLPDPPDGLAYVASTKTLWVTTPKDESLTVLDASDAPRLKLTFRLKVGGGPEGYAVDEGHGLFFTNLEDKNKTVVIDVKTHVIKATWDAGCGADGPRGLAVDGARGLVFVACTDHIQVLDSAKSGAPLGKLDVGAGVDNLDYLPAPGRLYVAAGKAGRMTVAEVHGHGELKVVAGASTHEGARNAVADDKGTAYLADSPGARLVVVAPPR
jgi:hypothetical protein